MWKDTSMSVYDSDTDCLRQFYQQFFDFETIAFVAVID
jgi:hypothetical protein